MTAPTTTTVPLSVHVLVYREDDMWVAQCLDFDLADQGPDEPTAMRRVLHLLGHRIGMDLAAGRSPLADLPQAPEEFFSRVPVGFSSPGTVLPVYVPDPPKARASGVASPRFHVQAMFHAESNA